MTCETCKFFDRYEKEPKQGWCRIGPPGSSIKDACVAYWPVVSVRDWCGQWKDKDAGKMIPIEGVAFL